MSALPPRLGAFREQLGAAVERDARRTRRRRAVVSGSITAVGLTAGVVVAVLAIPRGTEAPPAPTNPGSLAVLAGAQEAKDRLPDWIAQDPRVREIKISLSSSRLARVDGDRRFWVARRPGLICLIDAIRRDFAPGRRPGSAGGVACYLPDQLKTSMMGSRFGTASDGRQLRQDAAVVVSDGITSVAFGSMTAPVEANVAVFRNAPAAEAFVGSGPAGERRLVSSVEPAGISDRSRPGPSAPLPVSLLDSPYTNRRLAPAKLGHIKGLRFAGIFDGKQAWVHPNGDDFAIRLVSARGRGSMVAVVRPTKKSPVFGSYGFMTSSVEPGVRVDWMGLVGDGYDRVSLGSRVTRIQNNVGVIRARVPKGRVTISVSGPAGNASTTVWIADFWSRLGLTAPQRPAQAVVPTTAAPAPTSTPPRSPTPAPAPPSPGPNP